MPNIEDRVEVARGDLTPEQIERLDEVLINQALPPSSPHSTGPDTLCYACLNCGSIAETSDKESRDNIVHHFDLTCCGLTVVFHSDHRVLVDPAKLIIRAAPLETDI